jgi:hypothetical protein
MTFWNVKPNPTTPDTIEPTTLAVESEERRWATGRGYCVEARTAEDARKIVRDYNFTMRGYDLAEDRAVILASRQKVIVLSRAA